MTPLRAGSRYVISSACRCLMRRSRRRTRQRNSATVRRRERRQAVSGRRLKAEIEVDIGAMGIGIDAAVETLVVPFGREDAAVGPGDAGAGGDVPPMMLLRVHDRIAGVACGEIGRNAILPAIAVP